MTLSKDAKQEGSQLKALELLGKASGLFNHIDSKAEVIISSEQLKRELAGHLRMIKQRPQPTTVIDVNAKGTAPV